MLDINAKYGGHAPWSGMCLNVSPKNSQVITQGIKRVEQQSGLRAIVRHILR